MGGPDGAGQAVVSNHRQALELAVGDRRGGGHTADGRVELRARRRELQETLVVHLEVRIPQAVGSGVDDLPHGVGHHVRGDLVAVGGDGGCAEPAGDAPGGGGGSRTHRSDFDRSAGGECGVEGGLTVDKRGTVGGRANKEVEDDGGGDNGDHGTALNHGETDATGLEAEHDAVGGGQPERGTTGQDDGVDQFHRVVAFQKVRLAGAGAASAHVDGGKRAFGAGDDGAAGIPQGGVADADHAIASRRESWW